MVSLGCARFLPGSGVRCGWSCSRLASEAAPALLCSDRNLEELC